MEALRALLQFCTILPLGPPADYNAYMRNSYLLPVAGWVTGGIAALIALAVPVPSVSAALAIVAVLIITGCNHFDGLLDLGDAMMAHGSREKRIRALTDRQIGAGGVGLGMLTILLAYAGLTSVASIPIAILVAEVLAKLVMMMLITFGTPFKEGMFSYMHGFVKVWFPIPALLICLPLLLLPIPGISLLAAVGAAAGVFVVLYLVTRHLFGGINGDVIGASSEITRAAVIIALVLV